MREQQFEQQQSGSADRTGGGVINLLQVAGAQQVMLEVKVAEIARTELRRFEMEFNGISVGGSRWNIGGVNGGATFPDALFAPGDLRIPDLLGASTVRAGHRRVHAEPHVDLGHWVLCEPPDH